MKLHEFSLQFNITPDIKELGVDDWLIYFLVNGGEIVYIGKSSEGGLFGRLRAHQSDKEFTEYFTVNSIQSEADALMLEKGFISIIRPKYNKAEVRVNMQAIRRVIEYVSNIDRPINTERFNKCKPDELLKKATRKQWERAYTSKDAQARQENRRKALNGQKELEKIGYTVSRWVDILPNGTEIGRMRIEIGEGEEIN